MFTPRFIILALLSSLSLLASANASTCAKCPDTLDVNGVTYKLSRSSPGFSNGQTLCIYNTTKGYAEVCDYDVRAFWMLCSSWFSVDMLAMIRPKAIWRVGMSRVRARQGRMGAKHDAKGRGNETQNWEKVTLLHLESADSRAHAR
ncbi:uncharacterized protein EDB91DRAFT_314404 [Suillus paluster]|uniref:uncharacterized protein n=1 Tax=Suillus paluster TaxID=48578 RepID=UPI001B879BD1|nr:uncharacterized protein EDB91DRAFT_314404 [Suillus paluster]KAG1741782.1 hypothetical protein EDB91DRAFT_314404 [Suillus paluster]